MGVGVGENVYAVVSRDGAGLASRVPRKAGVTDGMDIAGAHALAHREERWDSRFVARSDAPVEPARRCRERESWCGLGEARSRLAAFHLLFGHQTVLHDTRFERDE